MLEKIKKIIKGNETKGTKVEEFDCKLNPFLRNYYEQIKPEEIKVTIKGIKNTIYTNKLYIGFLKNKIREGRRHYDIEIASMYECLLTREILDKEYMNNTGKHIIEFLKYRQRVEKADTIQNEVKDEVNNG